MREQSCIDNDGESYQWQAAFVICMGIAAESDLYWHS